MFPIDPINEETCRPHYGSPVGVILKDGTRQIGILSRVTAKELILNEFEPAPTAEAQGKRGRGKRKPALKAVTAPEDNGQPGVGPIPYSPWGGRVALPLADVQMLFLLFY